MKPVNGIFPGVLYPNAVVGGCIEIFENVWPNPEETINIIENEVVRPESGMYWSMATTLESGHNQRKRTNYDMCVSYIAEQYDNPVAQNIHNQFNMVLLASTIEYAKKHGVSYLCHEPYNLIKYSGGQSYTSHYDGTTSTGRTISAICYLNDDYVGGEIEFTNFDIKIKPEPGMLILFPSNYAYSHIAHPVVSGTKYAIVTWITDREV
jgi:predicted 2-oxoglutarate/Fe(II)-dependent dioxygenase YbiX